VAKLFLPYGDRWRTETESVEAEFRMAYVDLCWMLLREGGRVPHIATALARHARLGTRKFERFWTLYGPRFILDRGQVGHHLVDETLEKIARSSEIHSNNGRKGGQKTQAKQRRRLSPAKAIQTEGLDYPSYEGDNPNPTEAVRQAPPDGRAGLSDAGRSAFRSIRIEATVRPSVSTRDLDVLAQSLRAFDGRVFTVGPHGVSVKAFAAICEEADRQGYEIVVDDLPRLRVIAND
jgi:hypothetical protein